MRTKLITQQDADYWAQETYAWSDFLEVTETITCDAELDSIVKREWAHAVECFEYAGNGS